MFLFKVKPNQTTNQSDTQFINAWSLKSNREYITSDNASVYLFNWESFLRKNSQYQYSSSSIYKGKRQFITVDIDSDLTPNQYRLIRKLNPTNIIRRKSNGHHQIQWLTDTNFKTGSQGHSNLFNCYKNTIFNVFDRYIAKCDRGNVCSTIQNPYHKEFEIIYSNWETFIEIFSYYDDNGTTKSKVNSICENDLVEMLFGKTTDSIGNMDMLQSLQLSIEPTRTGISMSTSSRNGWFVKHLDHLLMKKMYHNKTSDVEIDNSMIDEAHSYALKMTGKTEPLTEAEIKKAVKQCIRFCKSHYNPDFGRSNNYGKFDNDVAALLKKCDKFMNIIDWKDGKSIKISRMTKYRYSKITDKELNDLATECYNFANSYRDRIELTNEQRVFLSNVKQYYSYYMSNKQQIQDSIGNMDMLQQSNGQSNQLKYSNIEQKILQAAYKIIDNREFGELQTEDVVSLDDDSWESMGKQIFG